MVIALCTDGPEDFSKSFWIDIHGEYRPYYLDKSGNTVKYPPNE